MFGKTIGATLGLGLMLAGPVQMTVGAASASAGERWDGGHDGWRGGDRGWHHDHDGIGAGGVILGLAAVAGVAALASSAAHHDGYYDRGYDYRPAPAYGYGYQGGYGGNYARVAIGACANAAVGQARGWSGYVRFGHVDAVEQRGDATWVRGTLAVGGGYDRDDAREARFRCKFDDGRVRSLHVDRPDYAYGY